MAAVSIYIVAIGALPLPSNRTIPTAVKIMSAACSNSYTRYVFGIRLGAKQAPHLEKIRHSPKHHDISRVTLVLTREQITPRLLKIVSRSAMSYWLRVVLLLKPQRLSQSQYAKYEPNLSPTPQFMLIRPAPFISPLRLHGLLLSLRTTILIDPTLYFENRC